LIADKKICNKNSLARDPSREDKVIRKERMDNINSIQPLNANKLTNTLHNFYKVNPSDNYQSNKAKNLININNKPKTKSFRRSLHKMKTPSTTKLSREEKNVVET
jgi:hypothetical protein